MVREEADGGDGPDCQELFTLLEGVMGAIKDLEGGEEHDQIGVTEQYFWWDHEEGWATEG